MDYCGAFKINNKCLDSSNSKLQLLNCVENSSSQKFIYDSFSKTIRPVVDNGIDICVTFISNSTGGSFELQPYRNSSSQKFNYDSSTSRFALDTGANKCINYSVDKFIASDCSSDASQKFSVTECTSSNEPVLEKILTSLKISKANPSMLSNVNFVDQTSSITKISGMDNMVYFAFYLAASSLYSFKVESKNTRAAPYVRGISLNTSPFMSSTADDTYKLMKGIHLCVVWLEKEYTGSPNVDYSIKLVNRKNGVESDVETLKLLDVGGIPMEEWLFSSLLNTMKNYNNNSNMKAKYMSYVSTPFSSYGNINNLSLQSMDTTLSNYSEYIGNCSPSAPCGLNSKVKFKEIIPASYGGGTIDFTDSEIFHYEKCNKFCRDEAATFSKWKEITKCPASKMPDSTKEKMITYKDETGADVVEESSIYIDNLRYYTDDKLTTAFSMWSTPAYKEFSDECYSNMLSDGNILRMGGRIFSRDGLSYLAYLDTGKIALFSMNNEGSYSETASIRPANPSKVGGFVKLSDGKLLIYQTVKSEETLVDSLMESLTITTIKINLLITTFSMMVLDMNGVFINRYGLVPSDLAITDEITEYKFKSPVGTLNAYEIIKTEETALVITKANLEFRVKDVDDSGAITETVQFSIKIASNEFICFDENGFYVSNGTLKTFESKASGIKLFGLYAGGVEMKNNDGWLIKNHGPAMSTLNSNTIIRRPTMPEESEGVSIISGGSKGKLSYQMDGNLVFYSDNKPIWNSNTQNNTSTHMMLDKSGEIFIMNDKAVVFRSNFSLKKSIFSLLFVFDEWFFICNREVDTDPNLYISRLYPNASDLMSNSMTSLISAHISINYKKYPNIVLVDKNYVNAGNNSGVVNTEYVDFTEFMRSNNFLQCSPTDFFCNFQKTAVQDSTNAKRKIYSVEVDTAGTKWSNVKIKSLITGDDATGDTKKEDLYKYDGRRLYGYTPLISSKYLGMNSSPFVKVKFASSSIDCILLIKKGLDDYEVNYDEALSYINSNMTSSAQLDMLDFKTSFKLNSSSYMLDPLKLSFADTNGDFERVDDVKMDYCGPVKIGSKCMDSGSNKVQIFDCNSTAPQKYIYDFITQTLRPSQSPAMAVSGKSTLANSDMELQTYNRGAGQKFIYDSDAARLKLVSDKTMCVELSNTANGAGFNLKPCSDSAQQNVIMNTCVDSDLKKILSASIKPPVVKYSITGFASELSKDRNYRDKVINNDSIISSTVIPLLGLDSVDVFKVHSSFSMRPDITSSFANMKEGSLWSSALLFIILMIMVFVFLFLLRSRKQKAVPFSQTQPRL